MKITIIGGGNIGTLMAGEFAHKGHDVTIYTSKPERWNKEIEVLDNEQNLLMTGILSNITNNLAEAVQNAEIIWVVLPAEMFVDFGKKLEQYITHGQMVGVVPGSGGAEFAFKGVIDKGGVLFGLQRVHSIARLEKYGKSVHMLGRKPKLELGSIPAAESERMGRIVSDLFDLPCTALPNYLCVTLTPSNPLLHTTRLYSMFKDYSDGVLYPRNFLFYEEWSDLASEMLINCDSELQMLCDTIALELKDVISLKKYYESPTINAMTKKISGIKAFKGLTSPMVECDGGWRPDFNSRYFTTDFPYGLKLIKDLAVAFDVKTPYIDIVWDWYTEVDPIHASKAFELNMSRYEFVEIYT